MKRIQVAVVFPRNGAYLIEAHDPGSDQPVVCDAAKKLKKAKKIAARMALDLSLGANLEFESDGDIHVLWADAPLAPGQ